MEQVDTYIWQAPFMETIAMFDDEVMDAAPEKGARGRDAAKLI